MKKFLSMALIAATAIAANAQKATVDQAAKLAGKDNNQARELLKQAMENPETAKDARTYYVLGKMEFDAYDKALSKQMINPQDPSVNPVEMANEIINGYNAFIKGLPFDSLPNEKGQVKPKYSKDMIGKMNGHHNDYWNAGGALYEAKDYYPGAYTAFMIYGDMPSQPWASKNVAAIPDSTINTAYFNAGISAYAGNALEDAAKAFKSARLKGTDNPQNYIYEIACWQYIANNDSTKAELAKTNIGEIAQAGFQKFGVTQPLFLNNLVNSYIIDNQIEKALDLVNGQLASNEAPWLYGLQGYIYDRMNKDDESVAAYKKAAKLDGVDFETLKNAAKKVFRVGTSKLNEADPSNAAARTQIKSDYFDYAKQLANQAKAMNADDPNLNDVIESIDYAISTYF